MASHNKCVIDLANEQMRSQTLSSEVETLSRKLRNGESELKVAKESLDQSQQTIENLSSNLKKMESLLELERKKRSAEVNDTSHLESVNKRHMSESQTEETSVDEQSLKSVRSPDTSSNNRATEEEETVRQLRESLVELEKEVCIFYLISSDLLTFVRVNRSGVVQLWCKGEDFITSNFCSWDAQ